MTAALPIISSLVGGLFGGGQQQQPQPDYTPLYIAGGAALLIIALIALKK